MKSKRGFKAPKRAATKRPKFGGKDGEMNPKVEARAARTGKRSGRR